MRVDIITIFPSIFDGPLSEGNVRIAMEKGAVDVHVHDLREYTSDKHRKVDDEPYGGGHGMVMKPEPFYRAVVGITETTLETAKRNAEIILFTPRGVRLDQDLVAEFAGRERLLLLCGRYEGIDERVAQHIATAEVSIGDYVLSGGEFAALVVLDAVARLIPGVVGKELSLVEESFSGGLLEYPQYTRPSEFMGWKVPEVLVSGNHGQVERWRRRQRIEATFRRRPDLLAGAELGDDDLRLLEDLKSAAH